MAEKQKRTEPQRHDDTKETSIIDDATDVAEAAFVTGEWNGLPMWTCGVCQWDTLDGEGAMLEHIRAQHEPPPPAPVEPLVQVYDRWGNPVERR